MNLLNKFKRILPDALDDQNTRFFKIMIYTVTGILLFMILSCTLAFAIMLKGAEEVMIPDVTGMRLEEALISAQDRGLNSRIQLKYSSDPSDKGNVIEQEPKPGTIKKAGSQMVMRVSRGAIIDKVENYVGWHINDLDAHLKTLFNTYGPLFKINEPLILVNSDLPEGTILEQQPLPGTDLSSGVMELSLVVSQGSAGRTYTTPSFIDLDFNTAMKKAASFNLPFLFTQKEAQRDGKRGVVVAQKPEFEETVSLNTILQMTITPPAPQKDKIFGILERVLPENPVAVDTVFYTISSDGIKDEIFKMKHRGGPVAIPYFVDNNTILVISVMGKDVVHYMVKK